jgi:thymidylate synthase
LLAIPATAQTKHIPLGDRIPVNGEIKACYTIEDYKSLLKVDASYDTCLKIRTKLEKKDKIQEQRIVDLSKAVEVQQDSILVLKKENTRLFDQWKAENKKRHIAENKPAFGSYLAWGTAGAFAVATAVLTTVIVLND